MKRLNSIDKIASHYDRLAFFVYGKAIRLSQTRYLKHISAHANVLVLGGGTGWWLPQLLHENTTCFIWYIDASEKMIGYAKQHAGQSSHVKFIHGTHEDMPDDIQFDVVITFFFLDLFDKNTLPHVIHKIMQNMREKSIWLVTDFVNKKKWHWVMLYIMYLFFRMMKILNTRSLPDWEKVMKREKFTLIHSTSYFSKFICSHLYHM